MFQLAIREFEIPVSCLVSSLLAKMCVCDVFEGCAVGLGYLFIFSFFVHFLCHRSMVHGSLSLGLSVVKRQN